MSIETIRALNRTTNCSQTEDKKQEVQENAPTKEQQITPKEINLNDNPNALYAKCSIKQNTNVNTKKEVMDPIKAQVFCTSLNKCGIKAQIDKEDNKLILDNYYRVIDDYFMGQDGFKKYAINEDELFQYIKEIKGNANFTGSLVTNLGNLEKVGGNITTRNILEKYSDIVDLGKLSYVGGNADLSFCTKLKSLGNLEKIDGNANFSDINLEDTGNLKIIGGNADFSFSKKLKSLGNLEEVKGKLSLFCSNVEDTGKLKYIGGNADFDSCKKLKLLSNLEKIDGNANIGCCEKLNSLGSLKEVKGKLSLLFSNIEDTGNLKTIGGDADFGRCKKLKSLDNLEEIKGKASFYESSLEDTGMLKTIGGDARFDFCKNLKTLGKVEKINGNAKFTDSAVEDISSVKYFGGKIDLSGSKLNGDSIPNLRKVNIFKKEYVQKHEQ